MSAVYEYGHSSSGSIDIMSNAELIGTRGPILFTSSGVFNIKEYGLKIGDKVNVICIGGGAGGSYGKGTIAGSTVYRKGTDAGKNGGYGSGGNGGYGDTGTSAGGGGNGGGSGYATQSTVTLNEELIAVTIGAGGKAYDYYTNNTDDANGGTTYFGSLASADGGSYKGPGGNSGKNAALFSGSGGSGGSGINISGTFTFETQSDPSIQGDGAVFIWY